MIIVKPVIKSKLKCATKVLKKMILVVAILLLILLIPINGVPVGGYIYFFLEEPIRNIQLWFGNSYIRNMSDWEYVQVGRGPKFQIPEEWNQIGYEWGIECTNDEGEIVAQIFWEPSNVTSYGLYEKATGLVVADKKLMQNKVLDSSCSTNVYLYQISDIGGTSEVIGVAEFYDRDRQWLSTYCVTYNPNAQNEDDFFKICEAIAYSMKTNAD